VYKESILNIKKFISIKITRIGNIINNAKDKTATLILEKFDPTPLWRGALVIGSGTAIAQLITVITTPIITRLYNPADFGILGVYSAILTILVVIASLRYEFAIPLPKSSWKAANLLILCLVLILVIGVLLTISLFFISDLLFSFLNYQSIAPYFWLIIIGFFGMGIYQALVYWAIRQRDYIRITRTKINQSFGGSLSKILLGIFYVGPIGLIIGYLVSNIAGIWTFTRAIREKDSEHFKKISLPEIKEVAREYIEFPLYTVPGTLINAISLQIPIFILSFMYDIQVVGWYSLAYGVMMLPSVLIANSITQAFYGEAAKNVRENPLLLKNLQIDTTKKLLFIAIPAIGIPSLLAPWLFPILFGSVWINAGWYCLPLSLVAFSNFIVSPTNKLVIYGFNNWNLYWNITRIVAIMVGFYIAFQLNLPPISTLLIFGFITLLLQGLLLVLNFCAIDTLVKKRNQQKI
jgi:O-antigen/teichoic acid export membrane protein